MRTIEITAYQFSELSEEAKKKAINECIDTNTFPGSEWWESTYEDAENIGLKITGFDLDRRRHCEGDFLLDADDVANKILEEHGKDCETYKTAQKFLDELEGIKSKYNGRWSQYNDETPENEREYDDFDDYFEQEAESDIEDANADFLKSILEDYSIMLQNEFEYLTSEEAIIESIEANEYEFDEHGKRI